MSTIPSGRLYTASSVQQLKDILNVAVKGDMSILLYTNPISLVTMLGANGGVHVGYEVLNVYTLAAASTNTLGGVLMAQNQAASVAADVPTLVANFNTLLANLKAAGVVAGP